MGAADGCRAGTAAPGAAACAASSARSTALRDLARARGLYLGVALAPSLAGTGSYGTIAATEFDSVTPENAMKWDATEPLQDQFSWTSADQVIGFAAQHRQRIRGHTLVWHHQLPSWVSSLSPDAVEAAMVKHVTTVAKRYAGKIYAWDVVNEVFDEDGTYRSSPFYAAMGPRFVAEAFRAARAADPGAKLYINDYGIEARNPKSDALYDLVRSLLAQGVPVDGVGFQAHLGVKGPPPDFQANLQRFAALGLDVAVTELDVAVPVPASSAVLALQASDYAAVVNACLATSRCAGITVWGVDDGHSWIPKSRPGWGAPLLFDERFAAKNAYTAVASALSSGPKDTAARSAPAHLAWTAASALAATDDVQVSGDEVSNGTRDTNARLAARPARTPRGRARGGARTVPGASGAATVAAGVEADGTPPTAPGTPVATDVTEDGLTLAWSAATDDAAVAAYDVYRRSGAAGVRVATVTGTAVSLGGLSPGTTYELFVKARDPSGNVSAASGTVAVTTGAVTTGAGTRRGGSAAASARTGRSSGPPPAIPLLAAAAAVAVALGLRLRRRAAARPPPR